MKIRAKPSQATSITAMLNPNTEQSSVATVSRIALVSGSLLGVAEAKQAHKEQLRQLAEQGKQSLSTLKSLGLISIQIEQSSVAEVS